MSAASDPPQSTLPYPPLKDKAPFVVLSDWDGTITSFDSNDYLTDNFGMGLEARRKLNIEILHERLTFRDAFQSEMRSIPMTFEECKRIMVRDIRLDPHFVDFEAWCRAHDVPIVIVSSGMEPLIRAVLTSQVGEEDSKRIDIIANTTIVNEDGTWDISYRHPSSGFGHDKSQAILPYRDLPHRPFLFFLGDGVSDLSAARHADLLLVKQKEGGENDLAAYCRREGIPHVLFDDFRGALKVIMGIVQGDMTKEDVLAMGAIKA
ncbi:hypothetical protein EXIGLDRAFT_688717 [Exidia glandulosa HHB12029]|uniref:HAD-like protein n=1 Tax=Exidia glandulosa HHB12029 TaxID=1314781 RepID=A0A165AVE1_EXIGL|nr:hypothetical protein EXIGLDRAFT_688717 [Exidia glandulosa HHB12029]